MKENDVIKALECCKDNDRLKSCKELGCPFTKHCKKDVDALEKACFDLINRQKAEIERLKGFQKEGFINLIGNCLVYSKNLKDYNDMRKGLKSEARKEFAERLRKRLGFCDLPMGIVKSHIEHLFAEMESERE